MANYTKKTITQNGVRRPIRGSAKEIWDYVTEYSKKNGYTPTFQELTKQFEDKNTNTVRTVLFNFLQFYKIPFKRGDLIYGRSFVLEEANISTKSLV